MEAGSCSISRTWPRTSPAQIASAIVEFMVAPCSRSHIEWENRYSENWVGTYPRDEGPIESSTGSTKRPAPLK